MQDLRSKNPGSQPVERSHVGLTGLALPLFGVVLGASVCPTAALAEPLFARACVNQTWNFVGNYCDQDESTSLAITHASYSGGAISLSAGAAAQVGSLLAQSRATMQHMGDWSSGFITAYTDASFSEWIDPDWEDWAARGYDSMNDIDHYLFDFRIEVSGSQSATYGGWGAAGAESTVSYSYSVGNTSGAGSKSTFGGENYGAWGTVDAAFLIAKNQSYLFSFHAHTFASGTKTYVPFSDASIDASADFSHTLKWLGITGLHAFDSSGNEIPLPADAYLPLLGRETGFDYWQAADPAPVPLPPTLLFMGCGLLGAAPYLRRKREQSLTSREPPALD
jgi:hypothetical protein